MSGLSMETKKYRNDSLGNFLQYRNKKTGIFSVCGPLLSGRILFAPQQANEGYKFLRNDLLCNDTFTLTGVYIMYRGTN